MTPDRPTIGILMTLGSQAGGAEALLGHLLRHKSERYHYVCGFLKDGPLVSDVRALGYDTTVFHTTRLSDVRNYLATVRKVRAWIKKNQMRAALSWMSKGHFYLGPAAMGSPARAVWFQHSVPMGTAHMDRLITLLPAKAVFCCSLTSKRCQDRLFPRRESHVCHPGVMMRSSSGTSQGEAREQLGLGAGSTVIGMVARLERWKGAHVFVEAAQLLLARYPATTFFIVGGAHPADVQYAEDIQAMVKGLDSGDRFILAGQRSMEEALLWQATADIIVHPVTGIEPFGMAIVEAMAQGKVVVASAMGGPTEIINNGVNGVLIESKNSQLLASTLADLLEDSDKRHSIEREATLRGRSFSIPAFITRFEGLIEHVLAPS